MAVGSQWRTIGALVWPHRGAQRHGVLKHGGHFALQLSAALLPATGVSLHDRRRLTFSGEGRWRQRGCTQGPGKSQYAQFWRGVLPERHQHLRAKHSVSGRNDSTQGGSGIDRMTHVRIYRAPVRTTAQRSSHVRRIPPEQSESDAMQHSELMAGLCSSNSQPATCSLRCPPGPSAGSTVMERCPALNDRLKICTTSPWDPGP